MNIPLDNLYQWVRSCSVEPLSIYTFSVPGSKNINDLQHSSYQDANAIAPEVVCHDQEPLNYTQYQDIDLFDLWSNRRKDNPEWSANDKIIQSMSLTYQHLNFYAMLRTLTFTSIFDRYILLHSEKNSQDVEKFSKTAEPVYYWCHGIIARDWYRFAEHDARLQQTLANKKTFLVYCRAWTGTREYRLKFLELLTEKKLIESCDISVLHQDAQVELHSYVCENPALQPSHIGQLTSIINNTHLSSSSADYCADDFVSTDISVVLETVAADTKIHLTEKTLRPIACGHPFMLVAGPGSLEYLKSYGFKTFSPWIDESYDQEQDVVGRMQMIAAEMNRINNLSFFEKNCMLVELKKIADHNKSHFFDKDFYNQIHTELIENLNSAVDRIKFTKGHRYLAIKSLIKKSEVFRSSYSDLITLRNFKIATTLRQLRRDPTISIKKIIDQFPRDFFIT